MVNCPAWQYVIFFRARGIADEEDAEGNVIPAPRRSEENKPQWEDNYSYEARKIRQEYLEYFNLEGAVSWQHARKFWLEIGPTFILDVGDLGLS